MTPLIRKSPVGWWILTIDTDHGEARVRTHTWDDAMRSLARVYRRRERDAL